VSAPQGLGDLDRIDAVFSGLAHPTRRQILTFLRVRGGALTSGQLASRFDCSWPTTTRHLGILVECGLLTVEKTGRERTYAISHEVLDQVAGGWIDRFR
jgi:DNA-binding transcriptional ArsR family regulator